MSILPNHHTRNKARLHTVDSLHHPESSIIIHRALSDLHLALGWCLSHESLGRNQTGDRTWATAGDDAPVMRTRIHGWTRTESPSMCLAPYDRRKPPASALACVPNCVYPVPPDLPPSPSPSQPPYPPNRRVDGYHWPGGYWILDIVVGGVCGGKRWLAGVTQQKRLRLVRRGRPFRWQHPLRAKSLGFLCLPCLPACLTTCPPPPVLFPWRLVLPPSRGILASLLVAGADGGRRRRVAVGREIHPGGGIRGLPQEAWSW